MCRVDYCDEMTVVRADEVRKARKPHRCSECSRTIDPGERYRYESLIWDGKYHVQKTCSGCEIGREWLRQECGGWIYGEVHEELREHLDEATVQSHYGLLRLCVAIRRKWRRFDGDGLLIESSVA